MSVITFLTIAIPTYNRSEKLERLLGILSEEISISKCKDIVGIFVSNNGSKDSTPDVLERFSEKSHSDGLMFDYVNQKTNEGAGFNVLEVYEKPDSEYIWWFSDDDILLDGKLDSLVAALQKDRPNLCNVGFRQPPYTDDKPKYSFTDAGFFNNKEYIHEKLSTKLTSMIVKKSDSIKINRDVIRKSYWPHVYMTLDYVLREGGYYIYPENVASCDEDYLSIRFPPSVIVELDESKNDIYSKNNIQRKHSGKYDKPDLIKVNIHFYRLHVTGHATLPDKVLAGVKDILVRDLLFSFEFIKPKYYRVYVAFIYHLIFNRVKRRIAD